MFHMPVEKQLYQVFTNFCSYYGDVCDECDSYFTVKKYLTYLKISKL